MAQGDCFEIKLSGHYLGQQIITVFHYAQLETGVAHPDLADCFASFETAFKTDLLGPLNTGVIYNTAQMSWVIGGNEVDEETLTTWVGTRAGEALPPFVTYSFLLRRTYNLSFNGHKRFPGVCEPDQVNGVITGTIAALLTAVQSDLSATIDVGGVTYSPVIVSRILNSVVRPTPYLNPVSTALFSGIGSQNTRKLGRGA